MNGRNGGEVPKIVETATATTPAGSAIVMFTSSDLEANAGGVHITLLVVSRQHLPGGGWTRGPMLEERSAGLTRRGSLTRPTWSARSGPRVLSCSCSAVAELLRVPLAMRLYADVQTSGDIVSLDGLVEIYLHDRCAVVARAVRTRPRLVLDRVLAAGKQLWESGSPMLSPADFDGCFPLATGIGAALLDSGLLIPAGAGYRFKFDDVSEWVQGQVLPLAELLREEMPTHGPASPIAAAIRRVSAAGDHEAVKGHLRVLLAARGPSARNPPAPARAIPFSASRTSGPVPPGDAAAAAGRRRAEAGPPRSHPAGRRPSRGRVRLAP